MKYVRDKDDLKMLSPLHCLMRSFDNVLKLIYHLKSETFQWTESSNKLGEFADVYNTAKKDSCKLIDQQTCIKVDIPDAAGKGGTTTNGNVCKILLKYHRFPCVIGS